jgi:glucan phosphoethanolaminetransferase (alkaline phosphatase superfamily)
LIPFDQLSVNMYTFNPLPIVDSLNNHGGFYFICFALIALLVIRIIIEFFDPYGDGWVAVIGQLVISVIAAGSVAVVSYNTGSIVTPANIKVEATFVSYQPEGYNIAETSGKTTRQVDHHEMWVVYMLPDETRVILRANPGQAYPNKVVLYKN